MDLQMRKYEFIKELFKVEKDSIMDKLEKILKKEQSHERDSIDTYNRDIDQGIKEIEKGEFYTQEEARKIASQW